MIALARRFQFVGESYEGDRPAISCDGLVPGASLDLTHWQGNRTPPRYKADTSTEIALNFAASPEATDLWADAVVVNNHFDTDGLLAIWVLLDPERAFACRDLLVAAAEAGDFDEWPALERGLWLDAAIRALGAARPTMAKRMREFSPNCPNWCAGLMSAAIFGGGSGTISRPRSPRSSRVVSAHSDGMRSESWSMPRGNPRFPARSWPGSFSPVPCATSWSLSATGGSSTTATSVPITRGPIPWFGRCCPSRMRARWPLRRGRHGRPPVCPA